MLCQEEATKQKKEKKKKLTYGRGRAKCLVIADCPSHSEGAGSRPEGMAIPLPQQPLKLDVNSRGQSKGRAGDG